MKVMTITSVTNPNCGYLKQFKYIVDLNNNGVLSTWIEWCDANCKHHWGWHFWQSDEAKRISQMAWHDDWVPPKAVVEGTKAYMSFESYDEMILFKLINISG